MVLGSAENLHASEEYRYVRQEEELWINVLNTTSSSLSALLFCHLIDFALQAAAAAERQEEIHKLIVNPFAVHAHVVKCLRSGNYRNGVKKATLRYPAFRLKRR